MISDGLISLVVIAGGVLFIVFAQLARRRAVAERGASLRRTGGVAELLPYLFWVPYVVVAFRLGPSIPVGVAAQLVGGAVSLFGVLFSLWAIVTLGRHYDLLLEVHAGHELVRSGPFRVVRHPVYTGLALHFLGACFATGNVLLILGTLFGSFPAFYLRARAEEQLLRGEFGAEYEAYAGRVGMLFPFL